MDFQCSHENYVDRAEAMETFKQIYDNQFAVYLGRFVSRQQHSLEISPGIGDARINI